MLGQMKTNEPPHELWSPLRNGKVVCAAGRPWLGTRTPVFVASHVDWVAFYLSGLALLCKVRTATAPVPHFLQKHNELVLPGCSAQSWHIKVSSLHFTTGEEM